jgi:hypothetical protein
MMTCHLLVRLQPPHVIGKSTSTYLHKKKIVSIIFPLEKYLGNTPINFNNLIFNIKSVGFIETYKYNSTNNFIFFKSSKNFIRQSKVI